MPREIVIIRWCDICWSSQTKTEAVDTFEFSMGKRDLLLDVCPEHRDPPLSQALSCAVDVANKPSKPGPKPARAPGRQVPCPMDGCQFVATNPHGLGVHLSRTHPALAAPARRKLVAAAKETEQQELNAAPLHPPS